ncbi:MAG: hypothetical protein ACLQO7_10500 [Candidatus Bathyarchaeia archaeon]
MNSLIKKGISLIAVVLISFLGLSFIETAHPSNLSDNSSLIGNLETVVNSVNYASDINAVYQGMIVEKTSMQQLINAYNALMNPITILQWTPILSKLGYANQTTIKWALDAQQMMSDGLPNTGADSLSGSSKAFLVYDRFLIIAYGYAIQYNYDLAKWNLTQAYNSFKASVNSATYPALLWVDQDGIAQSISYGPRYYDECGETIDCFLDFYSLGITTALKDALTTWLWTNNNLWTGTNYNYALNWAGYECEAGGFLQIGLKLWHDDSSLPDTKNLLIDLENRFLVEQFFSPQWLNGVVCHMAVYNPELRLENTVMAWASILGSYGELNSTYQTDVQDMLTGAGETTTPAWSQLLQSGLCGSNFPGFQENSDSEPSNDATATGADLLFMLGIVPQTAALAVPIEENSYEYIYNILDPNLFNINLTTNVVTISLATAGTLNFQFNQTVTGSFSESGIYAVKFSPNWNAILNINFVSNLPSNRQYTCTAPPSYYITSSADSNSVISPLGDVMVDSNSTEAFTYSADSGCTLATVIVDGSSVPIIGSYTFSNIQANHTISVTSTVNSAVDPLQIINVQLPSKAIQKSFMVPINITITNPDSTLETANIQVSTNSTMVFSTTVTLSALQTEVVACYFNSSVLAIGNYASTVTLTTTSLPAPNTETSTGQFGVTYLGDVNGDFTVNFNDIVTFVADYISYSTNGIYYPAIDYCHTGTINFNDLVLFVAYYQAYYMFGGEGDS